MWYCRQKSTGKWGAKHSQEQPAEWVVRYATDVGVESDDIEQVESEDDPREGELLKAPPPLVTVPDPDEELRRAIESATTVTELKDALLGRKGLASVSGHMRGGD